MNIKQTAQKCDAAIASGDQSELERLSLELEAFVEESVSREQECAIHYLLGNLNTALSRVNKEDATSWRDGKWSKYAAIAFNHLRKAELISKDDGSPYEKEIKTNLANELAHQRRSLEAMNYWQLDAVEGDAPFVSALSKGRELGFLSFYQNDLSHTQLYQYEAYVLFRDLRDKSDQITHPRVVDTIQNEGQVLSLLEFGDQNFEALNGWQNEYDGNSYQEDEKLYRKWCLKNGLFANPINDLTNQWVADQDILQFPNHVVGVKEGPYFSAAFSALKREYCFARFMAFEGIHDMHSEYEEKKLFVTDTLDYVYYGGNVEKIKTAFRICFSVFDSLASLMNVYFDCNAKSAAFSSRWIRENLKEEDNHFIDALYWLACDLTDAGSVF